MTCKGHVRGGRIELEPGTNLPEGATVRISVLKPTKSRRREEIPSLYERLKPIIGAAKGLPRDAARNIDHYLYGLPKR